MLAAAPIWTYWLGVALAIGALLTTVVIVIGYLKATQSPRYPKEP